MLPTRPSRLRSSVLAPLFLRGRLAWARLGLASALLVGFVGLAPLSRAHAQVGEAGLDADPWLTHLEQAWIQLDGPTRGDVAHIWGTLGHRSALPLLRDCAERLGPEAASCHLALMAMQDVDAVPILRCTLRRSEDPVAVGSAARGLAAFGDEFSRDLVLMALLDGRGGWQAADALAASFSGMPGAWREMYLAFGTAMVEDPLVRGVIAARAWPSESQAYRPWIEAALESALSHWWLEDRPSDGAVQVGQRVAGALAATDQGCRHLSGLMSRLASRAEGPREAHALRLLEVLPVTCHDRVAGALIAAAPGSLRADRIAEAASASTEPPEDLPARLVWPITLRLVASAAELPLHEEALEDLAHRLAASKLMWGLGADQWDLDMVPSLLRDAPQHVKANRRELARRVADDAFPDDFYGFNSFLDQPAWWPEHLHVTIDDGPRLPYLPSILESLDTHGVKATFFVVGAALARRWLAQPELTRRLLRRIQDEGHLFAFHSMNHVTVPKLHIKEWEPDQVVDSVELFRKVLNRVVGRRVPVVHGRLPGGMGLFDPWIKRGFYDAGLHEHVHWNAGPPSWIGTTHIDAVMGQACGLARRGKPTVILLHEYKALAAHLSGFFSVVKKYCPRQLVQGDRPRRATTAHWGRDL